MMTKEKYTIEDWAQYQFKNTQLIEACCQRQHPQFQRLEFLGDRVLTLILGETLYTMFPQENEGDLSIRYAYLASQNCMQKIGKQTELRPFIINQHSSDEHITEERLLGDAIEAIIAAVYLDGGLKEAEKLVLRLWQDEIRKQPREAPINPKNKLQEITMQSGDDLPNYKVVAKGESPDSKPIFIVEASACGYVAQAQAHRKKCAEKKAAEKILAQILS